MKIKPSEIFTLVSKKKEKRTKEEQVVNELFQTVNLALSRIKQSFV